MMVGCWTHKFCGQAIFFGFFFPSVDSEITSEENNSTFLNVTEFLKKKIALTQNVKGYPEEK